jgi:hypothetical protein
MLKKFVLILVGSFAIFVQAQNSHYSFSINESFPSSVLENDSWAGGGSGIYLKWENKTAIIDTGLGDMNRYRYMSLGPVGYMDGDFEAEVDFVLRRQDPWNLFSLNIGEVDGSWSVSIARKQKNSGNYLLTTQITRQGKTEEKETVETAEVGVFKISRIGNKLQLLWKPKNGQWKTLADATAGQGPVYASVYVASAVSTRSVIQLNSYKQSWQKDVANYRYPVYGRSKVLGDMQLMQVDRGLSKDGKIELEPEGKAVFAFKAPINARGISLNWESSGALKVRVTQVGSAESIQLGSTVLWDEQKEMKDQLSPRSASLEDYLSRYPEPKRIKFSHLSANNILFVTFQPSMGQKVVLRDVKVHGYNLLPTKVFPAEKKVISRTVKNKDSMMVEWPGLGTWWGQPQLPAGKAAEMCGIPFKINPAVLDKGLGSVEIPVNQKAGLFHFAHAVKEEQREVDWVGSYLIVYDDGTTETIFCNLGWNCGSFSGKGQGDRGNIYTWWGPASMTFARVHYLPRPGLGRAVSWNGIFVSTYLNPHPEKTVKSIILFSPPKPTPFALVGLTLTEPEKSILGLVEPNEAAFYPGRELRADVMVWSPAGRLASGKGNLILAKPQKTTVLGERPLAVHGEFGYAAFNGKPETGMEPGAVTLRYNVGEKPLAESSLLGWMPEPQKTDKPFFLTMIAGGFESRWEFERMRRLGYDAIKVHMGWEQVEPQPGKFDFSKWEQVIPYIHQEGLAVAIRNPMDVPSWLKNKISWRINSKTGQPVNDHVSWVDLADPVFTEAIVGFYTNVAAFLKRYPYVISINANAGTRGTCGKDGILYYGPKFHLPAFRKLLAEKFTLAQVAEKTGMTFSTWDAITPEKILADKTSFLLEYYIRAHAQAEGALMRQVVEGIRSTGNTSHLVFNTAMHNQWHTLCGHPYYTYLALGKDFPPASPFHESCDRYCLSFYKWLMAKRTFDLPYGDEGCLNPPPYEQNLRAYQWMMMFQCREACYCMWWNGKPGAQNIAWMKPYYQMIYNADYLADPVQLAFSFESGFAEAPTEWKESDQHKSVMSHYGLVNTLRATNINSDRYVIDKFPKTDSTAGKMLIDDTSRYIDDGFADRLEKYIHNGGCFLVTPETDKLRGYAFLKRFGISLTPLPWNTAMVLNGRKINLPGAKYKIIGDKLSILAKWDNRDIAAAVKNVGKGKILVLGKTHDQGDYDINLQDEYLNFFRKTICQHGGFLPNFQSDTVNVDVTGYRAKDGSVLVMAFNNRSDSRPVRIKVRKDLIPELVKIVDLGAGSEMEIRVEGKYWGVSTQIAPLHSTVIQFFPRK